jgi:transcriptional regulator with XRE-family HTH domain
MTDWRTRLRGRLAASGKTRAQVCSEAGLNPAYLTQILEQKGATPRIDNLGKLATVLNTTVCYLVDGVDIDAQTTEALSLYGCLSPERKQVALVVLRDMAAVSTGKTAAVEMTRVENV